MNLLRGLLTSCSLACWCTCLSVPLAPARVNGQEVDSAAVGDAEIERLIQQLQSGTAEERTAAEQTLLEIGSAAIARLPQVTDQTSEELRSRLLRIRRLAHRGAHAGAARRAASRVTLSGKMTLSAALDTLEAQTGNQVTDLRDQYGTATSDPDVNVDFQDVAYLEALDEILDQAGLKHSPFSGEAGSLGIENRDEGELPSTGRVAYHGPFRVEATRIEAIRALGNPNNQVLRLDLVVGWEPQSVPMMFRIDPALIEATYDDGSTGTLRRANGPFSLPVQEAVAGVELNLPFNLPPRQVKKIATLKGQLTSSLPGDRSKLVFEDLERSSKPQAAGSVTISIERVRRDGPIVDLVMVIQFATPDDPLSAYRGWVFQNPAIMIDGKGHEHEYVGLETMFQRDDSVALGYKFDLAGAIEELKLVYEAPGAVILQDLPFELHDLELP